MKHLMSLIMLVLFTGCASQQATIRASATSQEQMDVKQGAVALRLTVSGPMASQFFTFWDSVTVKSKDGQGGEKRYDISLSTQGATGSATYFGALPEGAYWIDMLSSESCGGMMCVTASVRFNDAGPSFNVEKGKITYLGNLIYANFGDKRSGLVSRPVTDSDSFRAWLKSYYPTFSNFPLSGDTGDFKRNEAAYRFAQDFTNGFIHGVVLPQGSVLFHNLSGSLREVTWPARARTINTGLNSRINALLALGEQHWVVAGDFNEARQTMDGGKSWQDIKLNLPDGLMYGLYKGKDGEVVAFLAQQGELNVYVGALGGPWQRLWGDKYEFSKMKGGILAPQIQASSDGTNMLIILPGAPSYRFNALSYTRSQFEMPGGIMQASISGDGIIRCRCNKTGLWVSTWESRDGGKTWQDSELSRTLPLPYYRDKLYGLNTHDASLFRTTDGGKNWSQVYKQERPYWPYILLPYHFNFVFSDERRIVATDTFNTLLASEDDGATWAPVRFTH